jgi:hypothetical protein
VMLCLLVGGEAAPVIPVLRDDPAIMEMARAARESGRAAGEVLDDGANEPRTRPRAAHVREGKGSFGRTLVRGARQFARAGGPFLAILLTPDPAGGPSPPPLQPIDPERTQSDTDALREQREPLY